MWRCAASAILLTGLVLGGVRAGEVSSKHAPDVAPALVSPYQQYDLKLRAFYPAPRCPAGVLLIARINGGRPLRLLLDSGAEFIVIAAKVGRWAGLSARSEMELIGLGSRPATVGRAATVEIGPVRFRNCPVVLVDGKVVEGADGVIPLSLFSDFLVRLNLDEKMLRLIPHPPEQDQATLSVPAFAKARLLLVSATLNGKQGGHVMLDTGAFCSAVSREFADTLSSSRIAAEIQIGAGTGPVTGQLVPSAVYFEIAGQVFSPNNVAALDLSDLSRHCGMEIIGVLGYPALSTYILTIDYRNGLLSLESSQRGVSRDQHRVQGGDSPVQLALR